MTKIIISYLAEHNNNIEVYWCIANIGNKQLTTTFFPSTPRITIVNLNDPPQISLDGEDPVITAFPTNYTEGGGPLAIVSNLFVVDTDPMAIIRR